MWTRLWRWLAGLPPLWARVAKRRPRAILRRKGYRIVARQVRTARRTRPGRCRPPSGRVCGSQDPPFRRAPGTRPRRSTSHKQRRLTRAALAFLRRHHLLEQSGAFDVVAVHLAAGRAPPRDRAFRINAFEPPGTGQFFALMPALFSGTRLHYDALDMSTSPKHAVILLSGGLDSTTTLAIAQQAGFHALTR